MLHRAILNEPIMSVYVNLRLNRTHGNSNRASVTPPCDLRIMFAACGSCKIIGCNSHTGRELCQEGQETNSITNVGVWKLSACKYRPRPPSLVTSTLTVSVVAYQILQLKSGWGRNKFGHYQLSVPRLLHMPCPDLSCHKGPRPLPTALSKHPSFCSTGLGRNADVACFVCCRLRIRQMSSCAALPRCAPTRCWRTPRNM